MEANYLHKMLALMTIDAKLSDVECRLVALENKIDGLEKKIDCSCHVGADNGRTNESNWSAQNETISKLLCTQLSKSYKTREGPNGCQVLEAISKLININVTDRQDYIKHYDAVMNFFISELKSDSTFKQIYKGKVMAGSYRDGLKILKPDEYDTILPFSFGDCEKVLVKSIPEEPAYCTIKVKGYDSKAKPHLRQFLDSEGYILQDCIMVWLQNLFRKVLKQYDTNGNIFEIKNQRYSYTHSINGPAFTFKIAVIDTDIAFAMDLVPAIPFESFHWIAKRGYARESNQIKWIAVPKPPKGGIKRPNRSFLCSYTDLEKELLKDLNQAKNLIRIFKKFRDNQQIPYIKSYYIKTIFLWQIDKMTVAERKRYWRQPLDVLFVDMFKIILKHIETRKLCFLWDSEYNMFDKVSPTKLQSCEDKLRPINSNLDKIMSDNPKALLDYILTSLEKKNVELPN